MTETSRMLVLSTMHLPMELGVDGLSMVDGVVAYPLEPGWLMWLPINPFDHMRAYWSHDRAEQEHQALVVDIQMLARRHGCDYVLFDVDGAVLDVLKEWHW